MPRQLTLGVIGHVDHGKTALVRALTGIETDRLEEEQQRGLSIVLGFAHLESDQGTIDLIDVPGHEDFIRTMLAGATGIDGVLLVVAANESVMPQTREHFAIARLLRIDRGVIALTKTDLVAEQALARLERSVRELVTGSALETAPLVEVSAVSGHGIDRLRAELETLLAADAVTDDVALDSAYLPIDRVFTMPGFGVIVTGTLRHGCLRQNQRVEVLPRGTVATIRALQNHGAPIEVGRPGQRVAVNLRGIGRHDLERGDVLASEGFLRPTRRLDVELELTADSPSELKNGAAVRLLVGTSEVIARVRLLEQRALQPGEKGYAQLRCQADIVTHRDERFILRSVSPVATLGGGRVLVVNAGRRPRFDAESLAELERTSATDTHAAFDAHLAAAGAAGASSDALRQTLSLSAEGLAEAVERTRAVQIGDTHVVARHHHAALLEAIVAAVEHHHAAHPKQQGLAAAALSHALEVEVDKKVLRQALDELIDAGALVMDGGALRQPSFDPLSGLPAHERAVAAAIEQRFRDSGLDSPDMQALVASNPAHRTVFQLLLDTGALVRLKTYDRNSSIVLHRDVLSTIARQLEQQFPYPQSFTVAEVRDLLKATRKSVVPLMEHLDSTGATVRDGSVRRLRVH